MMDYLEREWRVIVAKMRVRVGPRKRPLGELVAYAFGLALAIIWLMARWDYVMNF